MPHPSRLEITVALAAATSHTGAPTRRSLALAARVAAGGCWYSADCRDHRPCATCERMAAEERRAQMDRNRVLERMVDAAHRGARGEP